MGWAGIEILHTSFPITHFLLEICTFCDSSPLKLLHTGVYMCFFDAFDDTLVTKNDTGTQVEDKKRIFVLKIPDFTKNMG